MSNRYVVRRDNITPTGGNDVITIVSASNRRVTIQEIGVGGRGSTSSPQQVDVATSTGGTTGGGGLTPDKYDTADQPTASSTVNTSWSGQPTLATHPIPMNFNAIGGINRWIPVGGKALEARNGGNISIRANSGVTWQAMTIYVVFTED